MAAVAYIGCTTDHGGIVQTGKSALRQLSNFYGIGMPSSCAGDKVFCPIHGDTTIMDCDATIKINGINVALDGGLTSCGARIIVPPVPDLKPTGSIFTSITGKLFINNPDCMTLTLEDVQEEMKVNKEKFYENQFIFLNKKTNEAINDHICFITDSENKIAIRSCVDSQGKTSFHHDKIVYKINAISNAPRPNLD